MSTIIHFKPLYGALSEDPICYLLVIDDCKILLDCGWNDFFDTNLLKPLQEVAPEIDAVLLTYPDLYHLGALPYAVGKLGLKAPIFGTVPVFKMGQLFLYDAYVSKRDSDDFDTFTADDIDAAFENNFVQLKYSQHHMLTEYFRKRGRHTDHTVARRTYQQNIYMLGGAIWKITKETEDVIYAVDYNHMRDRHLSKTVLDTLMRPSLLITDAYNALVGSGPAHPPPPPRKERDATLIDIVMRTLRANGNVLLPTDTAGRVLELCLILEQYWCNSPLIQAQHRLPYSLVMLSHEATSVVDFAKIQLEWTSEQIIKQFENSRDNAFNFRHIRTCSSMEEFATVPAPCVVLTTMASLEFGFARELLFRWAPMPENALVSHTQASPKGTLAHLLNQQVNEIIRSGVHRLISLPLRRAYRVPLEGAELEEFERKRREEKRKEEERIEAEKRAKQREEREDAEDAMDFINTTSSFIDKHDLVVPAYDVYPYLLFRYPMYPFQEFMVQWDDYGLVVDPEKIFPELYGTSDTGAKDMKRMEMEVEAALEEEKPTKVVSEQVQLDFRCYITYIDFEGRADGRFIKNMIARVDPRRLIVIHGTPEAVEHLKQYCEKTLKKTVYAPATCEEIEVTSDSGVYKIILHENLMKTVKFIKEGDYELAYISGKIQIQPDGVPVLTELPPDQVPGHDAIFIGDPKLADLRALLTRAGFQTELFGGVIVCNRVVQIRKEDDPETGEPVIHVEGSLCPEYFRVRDIVYSQFRIL